MLRPLPLSFAPCFAAVALLSIAHPAGAEQVAAPAPQVVQVVPQGSPPPSAVVAQPAPTVVIQQPYGQPYPQPYPQPVYTQQPALPPGATYYIQAPAPPAVAQGPRIIKGWDEGQPIPPGYHVETHARTGLIVGGAVLFGSMYLISSLVAAGNADGNPGSSNPAAALWVPALGPFIQMTQTSSSVGNVFLAIDGLSQLGGIAMFTVGLAAPRTDLVRNDFGMQLQVVPVVARDHSGMALMGRF